MAVMEFQSAEYLKWLQTLNKGEEIGVRDIVTDTILIRKIADISPTRIIKLMGWNNKFKKGRNTDGWRLEPITEEFMREYNGVE